MEALPPAVLKPPRFKGFPRNRAAGDRSAGFDVAGIKADYLAAPELEWAEYCQTKNYNSTLNAFPWRAWVREKKFRKAFDEVRADIEREGAQVGPQLLLRQLRAVRQVPETAAALLSVIQHALHYHIDEARHDAVQLKQHRDNKLPPPRNGLLFSLEPSGAAMLASALKATTEVLHKSLGIDMGTGVTPEKWAQLVEEQVGKMDGTLDQLTEGTRSPVNVEVMGAQSFREAVQEAFQKWMDKPGQPDLLNPEPPPDGGDAHG